MIKKVKKIVICFAVAGSLLGSVSSPAQANIAHTSRLEGSRNSNNLVTATPFGRRTGTTALGAIRMRIQSNAITVSNGVARNNITDHAWTTQDSPAQGREYSGAERTRTIAQGYVASQVEIRPTNSNQFINRQHFQRNFN